MKRRCYAAHRKEYQNYGGRGIFVCDRWLASFQNFLDDMGPKPDGYTLDRIDNDGPYSPGNCRWVTRSAQELNKRTNRLITAFGVTLPVSEMARQHGITPTKLFNRLARCKDAESAIRQASGRP
jgi:hypothetical protein